jgi:hypothetical protein
LPLGKWRHIAVTYSYNDPVGTDPLIYVDGVLYPPGSLNEVNSPSGSFTIPAVNIPAMIGRRDNSSTGEWKGDMDDVRLYNRILSASEVLDLYNTGRACRNPDGFRGGDTMYNLTHHIPQYCNNREWRAMGAQPGDGGAGCSNPTGEAGDLSYNTSDNVMSYCEGDEWRAFAF